MPNQPGSPSRSQLPRGVSFLSWGWLVLGGVLTGALGLVAVLAPGSTTTVLALAFSLTLLLTGLGRLLVSALPLRRARWRGISQAATGALLVLTGVVGLVGVSSSLRVFAVLVGVSLLVAGAGDLAARFTSVQAGPNLAGAGTDRWRLLLLIGAVAQLALGLVFLVVPALGLTALAIAVGVVLLGLGAAQLAAAFAVRRFIYRALDAVDRAQGRLDPGDGTVIRGEVL